MLRRSLLILLLAFLATISTALWPQPTHSTLTLRQLTNTPETALNLNPSLSADGRTVVFESNEDLASTGGDQQMRAVRGNLTTDAISFSEIARSRMVAPGVSHDARRIVFASMENLTGANPDNNSEIFLSENQRLYQLTASTVPIGSRVTLGSFQPSLSDDGQLVAFSSNVYTNGSEGPSRIYLKNIDSGATIEITSDALSEHPKISGDASKLLYIRNRHELVLHDLKSSQTLTVADNLNGLSVSPDRAISHDGSRVVFAAESSSGQTQVFVYDTERRALRQVTSLAVRQDDVPLNPTISGDGKRVAFSTRRNVIGGNSDRSVELYLFDVPTASFEKLTDAPSQAQAEVVASLNRDGSEVAFNFPRVLSGPVSNSQFGSNSEIYLLPLAERPAFGELEILNAASFNHDPEITKAVAPGSIAIAKGQALAEREIQAIPTATGFPMNLDGTSVTVNGVGCTLLFISPAQVQFVVPPQLSNGPAEVVATNAAGYQSKSVVEIAPVSPGIFTMSADGLGDAVALNSDSLVVPPFDPTDNNLRVTIFATGLAFATEVVVSAEGTNLLLESILSSPTLPGLDEIHLRVPRSFRGAGRVTLGVSAGGRVSNPVTLNFSGSPLREIMINEFLADPPDGLSGDANNDGRRESADDEFVELVNTTARDINLEGFELWTRGLTNSDVRRHRFTREDILSAGTALVIFGGGNPTGPFGIAQVSTASSGGLSLLNSGGVISLKDASGSLVTFQSYGGTSGLRADMNQSLTRNPDIAGNFVLHETAGAGVAFSPGTKIDGTAFPPSPTVLRILVEPLLVQIQVGESTEFHARALGKADTELPDVLFRWHSNDATVAAIDHAGVATALRPGTTTITATGRGVTSGEAQLVVTEPPTPTPTPTPGPSPSPSPSPSPLPTISPTPSPTITPTPTPTPSPQPTVSPSPTPAPELLPPLVISEIRTRGPNGASDEFVELYNHSSQVIDIGGLKLRASSAGGTITTRLTITNGTLLSPHSHFLAVHSGYSGSVAGDQIYTSGMANDGGVAITLANDVVIDQVGFSEGSAFKEGMHLAPLPSDANQSYERRPGGSLGSSSDTGNNFSDFVLIAPSEPQNRVSNPTPGPVPSPSPTADPSPAITPSPTPSPSPSPSPEASPSPSPSSRVVISQIYGGGGNSGALFQNDFIEIFNAGNEAVSLAGWSVQYSSSTGTSWSVTNLTAVSILPGAYYLIQESSGGSNGAVLPSPDALGSINMAASGGKVALVNSTTPLAGACPILNGVEDLVGYGATASCFRGAGPAPGGSNTLAVTRRNNGCADSQNNANDFAASTPMPRNSASVGTPCAGISFGGTSFWTELKQMLGEESPMLFSQQEHPSSRFSGEPAYRTTPASGLDALAYKRLAIRPDS